MPEYTLLILGHKAMNKVVHAVAREVTAAVRQGCAVIVLKERDYGATPADRAALLLLAQLLSGYPLQSVLQRRNNDDSLNVVRWLCMHGGYNTRKFRICGADTGGWLLGQQKENIWDDSRHTWRSRGAVFQMVQGLVAEFAGCHIAVMADACADTLQTQWIEFTEIPLMDVVAEVLNKSSLLSEDAVLSAADIARAGGTAWSKATPGTAHLANVSLVPRTVLKLQD